MPRWLIGLSSGTSLNGVDAALVRVDGVGLDIALRLEHFLHWPYPRELRELLGKADSAGSAPLRHAALLNRLLGEAYAGAARLLVEAARFNLSNVFCLGCSGHALGHDPDGRYATTLNLGMAGALAERTGVTTLSDFRSRDLVLGGQGVPLTPLIDYLLFHDANESQVLVHLGGVASLLALPASAAPKDLVGFQAAPCCLLLDAFMQHLTNGREPYDVGGKHAVQGQCIEALLERWLGHPVLLRRPPKTISRKDFGVEFVEQAIAAARQTQRTLHDVLCTATHFVARAILEAIERFVPERPARILLSGGGTRNGFLWRLLEQQLAPLPVEKIDRWGVPAEARKAMAFAGLAALTLDGVPANLPSVTGASGPRLLGSFTPGTAANWARCLTWMAQHAGLPQMPLAA
jgi:anhydro-N-acetylmuramic acid kinase